MDVIEELNDFGCCVDIYDPWADKEEVKHEYGIDLLEKLPDDFRNYQALVMAVAHREFADIDFIKLKNNNTVIYDIKGVLPKDSVEGRL